MSSPGDDNALPRRRLRVPAALAVAFVGTSAAVSMWYGGCHTDTHPPFDAGLIESRGDADLADAGSDDPIPDAVLPDAPVDAAPPDTPPV